jgi:hypothetical protein
METKTNLVRTVFTNILEYTKSRFSNTASSLAQISSDTVEWVGILALHASTVPTLLGLMMGITDNTPPIDIVLIIWAALSMFFIKAVIKRDTINILTVGLGFIGQAVMMALIFFK